MSISTAPSEGNKIGVPKDYQMSRITEQRFLKLTGTWVTGANTAKPTNQLWPWTRQAGLWTSIFWSVTWESWHLSKRQQVVSGVVEEGTIFRPIQQLTVWNSGLMYQHPSRRDARNLVLSHKCINISKPDSDFNFTRSKITSRKKNKQTSKLLVRQTTCKWEMHPVWAIVCLISVLS